MLLDLEHKQSYNDTGTGPDACALVRYATDKDLPHVLEMYMQAVLEVYPQTILNKTRCVNTIIDGYNRAPCVLLEKNGQILGFAGLTLGTEDFSDENFIQEYMFYIKKQFRSMKLARMLSDGVKDVAHKFGLNMRFSKTINGSTAEKREGFLKRWGYKPYNIGVIYEVAK